jgi:hypothetical protein
MMYEHQDELARAPRYTDAAGAIRAFSAADLMYCAKIRGIVGRSRMRKEALLKAVVDYDTRRAAVEALQQAAAAATAAREDTHRRTRALALRQQRHVDPAELDYPYDHIEKERRIAPAPWLSDAMPGQPTFDLGDFPRNVAHYYWVRGGANDALPWLALCRLHDGVFVFFKGECDYTGFSCQGAMYAYASRDAAVLIAYGMCESDYQCYIEDTEPVLEPEPVPAPDSAPAHDGTGA